MSPNREYCGFEGVKEVSLTEQPTSKEQTIGHKPDKPSPHIEPRRPEILRSLASKLDQEHASFSWELCGDRYTSVNQVDS